MDFEMGQKADALRSELRAQIDRLKQRLQQRVVLREERFQKAVMDGVLPRHGPSRMWGKSNHLSLSAAPDYLQPMALQ